MGDTSGLGPDDVVTLVNAPQQDTAEIERPNAVVDLFEADRVLREGVGDKQQPLLEANRPGVGDALDDVVAGVLDGRRVRRVLAR
jgi:hypothetical protein